MIVQLVDTNVVHKVASAATGKLSTHTYQLLRNLLVIHVFTTHPLTVTFSVSSMKLVIYANLLR